MNPVHHPAGTIFENICHLKVTRRNAKTLFLKDTYFNSTALLYRERFLITAAHNVYSDAFSRVKRISVSCGAAVYDKNKVTESVGREAVRVATGYSFTQTLPGRYRRDFAVIRLNRPVRVAKGMALAEAPPRLPAAVRVAGYPGDEDDATLQDGEHMYEGGGIAESVDSFLLNYSIDTAKGVSGAPIWIGDDAPVAVAIHVGGTLRNAQGRLIEADVRGDIEAMMAELG